MKNSANTSQKKSKGNSPKKKMSQKLSTRDQKEILQKLNQQLAQRYKKAILKAGLEFMLAGQLRTFSEKSALPPRTLVGRVDLEVAELQLAGRAPIELEPELAGHAGSWDSSSQGMLGS